MATTVSSTVELAAEPQGHLELAVDGSATKQLSIVQPVPVPQGTPEYEAKRAEILKAFSDKIPLDLHLPAEIISNPPTDVSGIPSSCGILTPQEVEITETYDATGLAEAIATRKLTSETVVTAFAKRAIIAHQLTCCLTQWFMTEAVERAKELDAYLEKTGKTVGPLHGVPVSIKDHLAIAGTFASEGYIGSTRFSTEDSHVVSVLRGLGAVFYCKTNQPQSLMHLESDSHFGRVLNPFNINLSAGGSTGGEAALIAMKGSVLGVGSDIGGSIRGPSTFCGIFGFKPTSYLLPSKDLIRGTFPAELNIIGTVGPMCRSLRDIDYFMRGVLGAKPHLVDPRLVPIPWSGLQASPPKRRFKIGIIANDSFIEPQPPVKRALAWVQSVLSAPENESLVEVKPFSPFQAPEGWRLAQRMYWPDGGKYVREAIRATGEPVHPLTDWICAEAEPYGENSPGEIALFRQTRDKFRYAFAKSWNDQDVDVVIGPGFVGPACRHETAFYWTYTSLYNLVDYPGIVVPTPIKVTGDEKYAEDYVELSEQCKKVKELWEEGGFEGAPISLQIIGRKYGETELFEALSVLKDILKLV